MKAHFRSVLSLFFFFVGVIQGVEVKPPRELEGVPSHDKRVSVYDFWNSEASSSSSATPHNTNTDETTTPLDSIVRQLNNDGCMTFAFSSDDGDGYYQDDYVDVEGSGTTLQQYCDEQGNNCCHSNDYYDYYMYNPTPYYDDRACGDWSTNPMVHYKVCPNSCVGAYACRGVARNAGDGSTIHLSTGSCSDTSDTSNGGSCYQMAESTTKQLNLFVGENSCTNENSCFRMAAGAANLESIQIESSSCTRKQSCAAAAWNAQSLKQISIKENECNSSDEICRLCGEDSTFSEALQMTETCCAESGRSGTACQYSEPSASKSKQPSTQPSTQPSLSTHPSNQPSTQPSLSTHPSNQPSIQPSTSNPPSSIPSDQPSTSNPPSLSAIPSNEPSTSPSISSIPTIPSVSFITNYLNVELSGFPTVLSESDVNDLKNIIKDAIIQDVANKGNELARDDIEVESNTSRRLLESRHLENDQSFQVSYDGPSSDTNAITENINSNLENSDNTNISGASAQVSSVAAPTPTYVEPPSPCANQKCNNAGHCKVTSSTEFICQCETTFINSANGRSCVCPPGFVRKSDNRCYDPSTPSPITPSPNAPSPVAITTKAPTSSPNVSNTPAPTSSPSQKIEDEENEGCTDDENATFYLIRNPNRSVKCSWLSKHKSNTGKRIANYCDLPRVKTVCKSTCSFCTCVDDESFTFELTNIADPSKKNKTCNWLTANKKKRAIRISRYCTEDFDDGDVMNACTKSCGLCE